MRTTHTLVAGMSFFACAALGCAALPTPPTNPEKSITAERLAQHIRDLPELRAAYAAPGDQQGLKDAEELILAKLRAYGYEPVEQKLDWTTANSRFGEGKVPVLRDGATWRNGDFELVDDPEPRSWRNIYVEIPGRTRPEETLIVGAHFDAVPTTPGADDNASGTAAVLELARVLHGRPMDRTVRLVFFNLEEIGLVGAIEHARWTKARIDAGEETVVGMVSVEMIGYYTDEPDSQRSPIPPIEGVFEPPTVGNFIAFVATQASAPFARELHTGFAEAEPYMETLVVDFIPFRGFPVPDSRRSDHAPFWDIGVPAVLFTDTSELRTPHYHGPTDTLDTLDHEKMARAVRGLARGVWRLAGPTDE